MFLFLFWVFRLSFVEFLLSLRQILSLIKALRAENVDCCGGLLISILFITILFIFFWVVALGRQFTEPLSADAALSSWCGAQLPAQYKSNPDQKWISIQSNVVTKF